MCPVPALTEHVLSHAVSSAVQGALGSRDPLSVHISSEVARETHRGTYPATLCHVPWGFRVPEAQLTILIVDDNLREIRLLTEALQESLNGIIICSIASGEEVVHSVQQSIRRSIPDGIVLDYRMPLVSGLDILQQMAQHAHWSHIPRIMLTGVEDPKIIDVSKRAGATDVRFKPRTYNDYLALAREIIGLCQKAKISRMANQESGKGDDQPAALIPAR